MSSSRTEAATLVDVTMPQMGVSVAEGTVVAWRVEVGDRIGADETICEISTDKIDTEVPAPVSGIVAEILVPVETTVTVGTVLARIAAGDGAAPGSGDGGSGSAPGSGDGGSGSAPASTGTVPPDASVSEPAVETPAGLAPGDAAPSAEDVAPSNGGGAPAEVGADRRRYSPVVQRIAAEHGVDLSQVPGTGRGGRVRKQDVLAFLESAPEPPLHIESPYRPEPEPAPAAAAPAPAAAAARARRLRRRRRRRRRRPLQRPRRRVAPSCLACAARSAST